MAHLPDMLLFIALVAAASASSIAKSLHLLTGHELVDHLNAHQSLFKAELSEYSMDQMKARAMDKKYLKIDEGEYVKEELVAANIPDSFDSRTQWPICHTIGTIYDQANCGSCWAFASGTSMSDRYCVAAKSTFVFSPADILSCCPNCAVETGCEGGYPLRAFQYWVKTGVCSGGAYGSKGNCKPYQFAPCGNNCSPDEPATPKCQNSCQAGYSTPYTLDRKQGTHSYLIASSITAVQKEIMTYGPVATCFDLYEDFYHYKSGIYKHTAGKYIGGHCVKVLGWGSENGTPYWLAANQWNTTFGENGFFRVTRGDNGCGFDSEMMAGNPKV